MSASTSPSTLPACRIGFVGAGGITREHIRAFADVAGVEIVGLANRSQDKARALADEMGIADTYADVDALCDAATPDLVVMAVYEPAIRAVAERCLARDVALFMEKPIGLDLADARAVAAMAEARGRRVWVGLNRRALGSTRAVLADLADDPGPRFIHVQDQQSLETARAIGHAENVVANWMFANSIHMVDYLPALGRGAIEAVEVLAPFDAADPGVVLAKVAFSSGDLGLYEAIWNGPGPWACTVSTPRRRWEMRPLEKAVFQNAGERSLNPVEPDPADASFKPGFRVQAERVVRAWAGEADDVPTIADALASTELVARIYGVAV